MMATSGLGDPIARFKGLGDDSASLLAATRFVEGTYGYWGAKPVLAWRYALGHGDFEEYPFRRPGESFSAALTRHGMGQELLEVGLPIRLAAWQVHDLFLRELIYRIESEGAPRHLGPQGNEDLGIAEGEMPQLALLQEIRAAMARMDWEAVRARQMELGALQRDAPRRSA